MFTQLDSYLNSFLNEERSDYWYDEGITQGQLLADKFSNDDWVYLVSIINDKPKQWILCCLDIISGSYNEYLVNLLISLMKNSKDTEILETCIDSINELLCLEHSLSGYKENLISTLNQVESIVSPTSKNLVRTLIDKISSS